MSAKALVSVFMLASGPWKTFDPFLFCVHHLDRYPAGTSELGPDPQLLRGRDIGSDFSYKDGWSMYHGETIPGFPPHPHRGFETITCTVQGLVDHFDSVGATARYGQGDTQWLTTGGGVQHSEMFPMVNPDGPNTMELFQIWLNLPAKSKMVKPYFTMFWNKETPVVKTEAGVTVRVIAGTFEGAKGLPPPPDSWASAPDSDVAVWIIEIPPNAEVTLPPAQSGSNRAVYYYQGKKGEPLLVSGTPVEVRYGAKILRETDPVTLEAKGASEPQHVLVLQGKPIGEPVAQHGPFVMNTQEQIAQTFRDYQKTQFGGWPWKTQTPVHPPTKGRFAIHTDGREENAP